MFPIFASYAVVGGSERQDTPAPKGSERVAAPIEGEGRHESKVFPKGQVQDSLYGVPPATAPVTNDEGISRDSEHDARDFESEEEDLHDYLEREKSSSSSQSLSKIISLVKTQGKHKVSIPLAIV